MPAYDCGDPDCKECDRAFGPDRTRAIAMFEARSASYAALSEKSPKVSDGFPRRNDLCRMAPAELLIVDAMYGIEAMPADTRLTQAQSLLQQAKDLVSDHVDGTTKD